MTKSELHRMLQNPIYTGDFRWLGEIHHGSHTPLISHETFARVQAVLQHKPRGRYQKHRHPFMGLLTCGRCGCAMTAERKKARYVYYRCTGFKGLSFAKNPRWVKIVDVRAVAGHSTRDA